VKHLLPPLPYDYAALEPHIDAQTMMLHHDKHHASYGGLGPAYCFVGCAGNFVRGAMRV